MSDIAEIVFTEIDLVVKSKILFITGESHSRRSLILKCNDLKMIVTPLFSEMVKNSA